MKSPSRVRHLVAVFAAWKLLLFAIACASPGPGYDTSTRILLSTPSSNSTSPFPSDDSWFARAVEHATLRLTRWDAIYFSTSSSRGHLYEQEWAFSWLFARLTSATADFVLPTLPLSNIVKHALAGTILSNLFHLLAVLVLYHVIYSLVPSNESRKRQLAFVTAALHVFSPAGLFLIAPYAETAFALFNFLGIYTYIQATKLGYHSGSLVGQCAFTIASGVFLAIASAMRSNGILSGIPFAWDALAAIPHLPQILTDKAKFVRLASTVLAGIILAFGYAAPQIVAYFEYCVNPGLQEETPWCSALPPSIYSYVQSHYWNVGFLRYWTPGNIPLFLLAAPMATVMATTAISALTSKSGIEELVASGTDKSTATRPKQTGSTSEPKLHEKQEIDQAAFLYILPRLAIPQLLLVALAVTSFHVQIINRISSGYPLWYFVLALGVLGSNSSKSGRRQSRAFWVVQKPELLVRLMVGYAIVQGGLFAAFLPPA